MNTHELAWAAGLFDGEGYVGARLHSRSTTTLQANIDISQNDRYVLDRFQRAVGVGKVYGPYSNRPNRNPQFHYMAGEFQHVQAIIAMLWTWLSPIKREQARLALQRVLYYYRQAPGRPKDRPGCKNGHIFDKANTLIYTTKKGYQGRLCRACAREKARRLNAKKRARKMQPADFNLRAVLVSIPLSLEN